MSGGIHSRCPGHCGLPKAANALLLGICARFLDGHPVTTYWPRSAAASVPIWRPVRRSGRALDQQIGGRARRLHLVRRIFTADLHGLNQYEIGGVAGHRGVTVRRDGREWSAASRAGLVLFRDPFGSAWLGWYAEEVLNYTVILPVIPLTRPRHRAVAPGQQPPAGVPVFLLTSAIPACSSGHPETVGPACRR